MIGLPEDIEDEEFVEFMKKAGMIKEDEQGAPTPHLNMHICFLTLTLTWLKHLTATRKLTRKQIRQAKPKSKFTKTALGVPKAMASAATSKKRPSISR